MNFRGSLCNFEIYMIIVYKMRSIMYNNAIMTKLTVRLISLLMSSMLLSCATTNTDIASRPSLKFAEATLTKRLYVKDTTAVPIEPTLIFTTDDNEAISYVKLTNLEGEHRLRWDWINPKGEIYSSSGDYILSASKGMYQEEVVAWHRLSIRGDKASYFPGEWQIIVYLDGSLIIQKGFSIVREKADEAN